MSYRYAITTDGRLARFDCLATLRDFADAGLVEPIASTDARAVFGEFHAHGHWFPDEDGVEVHVSDSETL